MNKCRNATKAELDSVLGWAAEEGWNPGLDDVDAFFQSDPEGFFIAVDDDDDPIASISVVNHNDWFAFLGLYIVRPELRGRGTGFALWKHALKHAGIRSIGLDGVEAQQGNYRRSGFVYSGGTTRFSGRLAGQASAAIRLATPDDTLSLVEMEALTSGISKPNYLQAWFSKTSSRSTLILERRRAIVGFATVRACVTGAKIGPLIASDVDDAQTLIMHAATLFDGPLTVDVPETAFGLTHLCHKLGFEPGFRTARMYRGEVSVMSPDVFAVTSLELG